MAQVNATVGDISANADLVMDWSKQAADAGAHLVLFPEMMLTGYPVEDLALRRSFVEASRISINRLATRLLDAGLGDLVAVVGYLDRTDEPDHPKGGHPQNVAAVLHQGQVICSYAKHHLPNYGVFDEYRYFKPGNELHVLRIRGIDVAIAICEDLWQDGGPVAATAEANAGLLAVINASPYERDKDDVRGDLVTRRAREAGCPLAYVNLVGGQDELVFDGDTMIAREDGTIVVRALQFVEELVVADLELAPGTAPLQAELAEGTVPAEFGQSGMIILRHHISDAGDAPTELITPVVAKPLEAMAEVYLALVMGLRDYCSKNGIERVYLGLSGGIDSTLVATLACDALGADRVYGISNPSAYSSEHSKSDAAELAARTGLHFTTVPIAPAVDAFDQMLDIDGIAAENLQARIRAVIWMAESNQHPPRSCWPAATRASSPLATAPSTVTPSAATHRSRTCRRPGSGGWPAGGTSRPYSAVRLHRSRRTRSSRSPALNCGRVRRTPTRCRRTSCSTMFWTTMWKATRVTKRSWRWASILSWQIG